MRGSNGGPAGERRTLPVPDGLHGMRMDQAVSRLFGLSRTAAAAIVEAGDASLDGRSASKSEKVTAGSWLDITLPPAPGAAAGIEPAEVEGLRVVYADADIVV